MAMTEQQPFEVMRRYPTFELRRYPAHLVAEVTVRSSFDSAGNIAFRSLFGYITGQNRSTTSVAMTAPVVQSVASEKIAMTAPVVQQTGGDGEYVIAFVLPASMSLDAAPEPTNSKVRIRQVDAGLAAAKAYSGRWSQSAYDHQCAQLLDAVVSAGLLPVGSPRFARFDPPFKPWFLRRNEVVIDVAEPEDAEAEVAVPDASST